MTNPGMAINVREGHFFNIYGDPIGFGVDPEAAFLVTTPEEKASIDQGLQYYYKSHLAETALLARYPGNSREAAKQRQLMRGILTNRQIILGNQRP